MNNNANGPPIRNVLYFSKFSSMCKNLLKLMHDYDILDQFYLNCIDDMSVEELPCSLNRVPTLIIGGVNEL